MTFNAEITAPSIPGIISDIGAGTVSFLQTIALEFERSGSGYPDQEVKSPNGKMELDTGIPYGITLPLTHEWPIGAGDPLSYSDQVNPLKTYDSPRIGLELNPEVKNPVTGVKEQRHYTKYKRNDSFVMYLMYQPSGNNENGMKGSICVPLQQLSWTLKQEATWNGTKWVLSAPLVTPPTNYVGISVTSVQDFPTWESNRHVP